MNNLRQVHYKNAIDFIKENQYMMSYKIDFEGSLKTVEEIARQASIMDSSIIKTERDDGFFDIKAISSFASKDDIDSIMKKTIEEVSK